MKTVAIITPKGGAGKKTRQIRLSVASGHAGGPAAVIGPAPERSFTGWGDHRDGDKSSAVSAQATRQRNVLDTARHAAVALAILSTERQLEGAAPAAARAREVLLIPGRRAIHGFRASHMTIHPAKLEGGNPARILKSMPPRGALGVRVIEVRPLRIRNSSVCIHSPPKGFSRHEFDPCRRRVKECHLLRKRNCPQVRL